MVTGLHADLLRQLLAAQVALLSHANVISSGFQGEGDEDEKAGHLADLGKSLKEAQKTYKLLLKG